MARPLPHILIVDDDTEILELCGNILSSRYKLTSTSDWLEAANELQARSFDLLILDLKMPVFDPVEFIKRIKSHWGPLPIMVMSAYPDLRIKVANLGVNAILAKPFPVSDFENAVSKLVPSP